MKKSATLVPEGFLFSAVEASIKKPGRKDLALICSKKEAVLSGVFTTNKVKAAPVKLDMKRARTGKGQAIIVNSGNANACTGDRGMGDAVEMTELIAVELGLKSGSVYVCSTGVIGTPMPMERIRPKITELANNLGKSDIHDIAAAIMTTDTVPKIASEKVGKALVTGVCKGAGMICPNMATMLCFIMTDVNIEKSALDQALKTATKQSFNRITIDGDMSTNDTVLAMANGAAGNKKILLGTRPYKVFEKALSEVTYALSKMIVRDGEGASKLVEIEIKNAKSDAEAEKGAFAVANSLLVKTALYGNDANWGRLMAALGYSGIHMSEEKTNIFLNGLKIVSKGMGTGQDKEANARLKGKEVSIEIDLGLGRGAAKVLTCDLSEEYVKINAEYRT